ncbi:MAG: bifunctional phosphoribosylaminoimidazolecarboxamide formyltransferase/IMP cyclohydrolase [Dehalococcoidia bacterium]|nr:bifunctional phosphoribosylaminoimidazolecarboxamide formyltransferase/IMP cyclohydrolase [Dehalococcoidia bacterium]
MRAILSVFDKKGLIDFARGLTEIGTELYSTGGTQRDLAAAGVPVASVSELTAFPEILDGRVKTLHPAVYAGILARRDIQAHMRTLDEQSISPIDLVVCNLYPFVRTVTKRGVKLDDALENIDIGGPTLIRAAAKNFPDVTVVVDPADYGWVLQKLRGEELSTEDRRGLALKAFQHVASYDTAVAEYLRGNQPGFPETMTIALRKSADLRYGENPHQAGAVYVTESVRRPQPWGVSSARKLHGLDMSYINYLDADAAWEAAVDFREPAVVIVKHATPCGIGEHADPAEAYRLAFEGDTVSAYGGIVAVNGTVTHAVTEAMKGVRFDIIMARDFEPEALERLRKRKDVRLLKVGSPDAGELGWTYRSVAGGMLVQEPDRHADESIEMKVVTSRAPTAEEREALLFAWKCVKHIKSNGIVLAARGQMLGAGTGQTNRLNSVMLAIRAAGERAAGSVLASDAFFPFADGVELAAEAGVTAIIQPGGSIRDEECIDAAERAGVAMVLTGVRHFKH